MYSMPLGTAKPLINFPAIFPNHKTHKNLYFPLKPTKRFQFNSYPRVLLPKASSNAKPSVNSGAGDEDFVTREKESLSRKGFNEKVSEILKILNLKALVKESDKESGNASNFVKHEGEVYLKDLLREYKGKLYVPEQVFGANLSEEEEFEKNVKELPRMSYEDFQKYMNSEKIKLVSFKEDSGVSYGNSWYRDFVVDLKEIPGDKSLHRTKWAMRLDEEQVQDLLERYKGPRNEIEKQTMFNCAPYCACAVDQFLPCCLNDFWVGKLPDYPHPVASKISSRMMVELGVLTAAMVAAAVVVGGFWLQQYLLLPALSLLWLHMLYGLWPSHFSSYFWVSSLEFWKESGIIWDIWQGIEFSQSKPQARVDGSTGVMFNDVAGIEEAVEELQECRMSYEIYYDDSEMVHCQTLVAKAIAGEAGVPFYQMAGSEFVEVLVGVGSARIRDLFKRAKVSEDGVRNLKHMNLVLVNDVMKLIVLGVFAMTGALFVNKPSVIFIDEIDALATSNSRKETTLNQLLIELDGFDTGKGVIFLGATNRKDLLDPALLRPGRFDRKIRIRPPNAKGRLGILEVHARKVKLSDTVDLSSYANNLPGWTGAKLAQLLQEAALVAVRKGHAAILQSDMDDAVDRLTVGPKRVGIDLGHQGQCRRATAEVGTALTSHLLRRIENAKVERCDRTLSQVVFHRLDDESYMFERRPQLLHRLQVFLGGRAAEEVIFGRDTSKASVSYLADASWLARKIITVIDFEGSLYDDYDLIEPPVNFKLDDDIAKRTEELMHDMYGKTVALLRQHNAALLKTVKVSLVGVLSPYLNQWCAAAKRTR
ncbi:hypothetical protein DH2020_005758 [Rehmannia glutinosa]|uniref:Uncharacterized protein n=1 Tax=Rehmannia glutinosa TaxID=99300 RepID=A0ABR0XGY2_REHGL